jgi:hypothetical protein
MKDGMVTFTYKDRNTKKTLHCTVTAVEFIRRFLLHTLSTGFVTVRHFGFLSNRNRTANVKKIRDALGASTEINRDAHQSLEDMIFQLTGMDITLRPHCKKGRIRLVAELPENTHSTVTQIIRREIIRKAA